MILAALLAGAAFSESAGRLECQTLAKGAADMGAEWREVPGSRLAPGAKGGAGDGAGFCRIHGILRPQVGSRIGFELWLPERHKWNGRFQMLGNGGYSSALPLEAMRQALARGNAVAATDTGHEGEDPDFAIGRPQAIVDWGWRAVHATAVAAKTLVARFYGRTAHHSYFNGCSTGGQQAMSEAQRFPEDFDGIVAGAPGSDRVRLNAAFLWQFLANHRYGEDRAPILSPNDLRLLTDYAKAQCGKVDQGVAGGIAIGDPLSCKVDPAALLCRPGQTSACLTAEKVAAARKMYEGAPHPRTGKPVTFPWLPGSEMGWAVYWADPAKPDQPARVNFWRIWAGKGSAWNWWRFSFARDLPAAQRRLSDTVDATSPDLSEFRARGGKLLQYHGLADPVVSPLDTLAYRRSMIATTDPVGFHRWYRLFLIPGMGHCQGGDGFSTFDAQSAIEAWVEQGQAPDHLEATSASGATRGLCPYPQRAVYRGGDPKRADSHICQLDQ